ncbi:adenosine receptor A3-like [Oculina patagonica]
MVNLTDDGNFTTTQELFRIPAIYDPYIINITISAFNIPLSVTAFLGNVLLIVAFKKVSSLHPPSKLLLGCLASTDLCVGLITQPLYVYFLFSSEHSQHGYYSLILANTTSTIFCGVSLLTLTAISVDRLLALLLRLRYRQVVTLRRVWIVIVTSWVLSTFVALSIVYSSRIKNLLVFTITTLCLITSTFCCTKIYLTLRQHQAQVQDHVYQGQQNGGGIPLNIARYRKTVSSSLWVQITLVACYLPYGIVVSIFFTTGSITQSLHIAWDTTVTILYLNSTLNPFLYCWKIREVKQAVKTTITQFC